MITNLPARLRQASRLASMTATLAKYGLVSTTKNLSPGAIAARLRGQVRKGRAESTAYLLRKIIEELGTTYIKFGQWLSVRPDFVPPEIIEELEKLQDRLPPKPFSTIRRTIETETGEPLEQTFSRFDRLPISTASIAQVHRAVLVSGEEVAVKVQHPDLRALIDVDTSILRSVANWAVKQWPHLELHQPQEAVSVFRARLLDEVDFTIEAKNQERMAHQFKDVPWVRVPKVYWKKSTEKLLVMEFLDGLKIKQKDQFEKWKLDPIVLSNRLNDCMFRQIFEFAFFQSDPHPGNILFMRDNQIGLIDFGIIDKFDRILKDKLLDWIYASVSRDIDLFVDTFLFVSTPLGDFDELQFRNDCTEYVDEIYFNPPARISFARLVRLSNLIQYRHKIATAPRFVSIFKTISTLEGLARRVDPNYDWRKAWAPRLKEMLQDRYSMQGLYEKYSRVWKSYDRLMEETPDDFRAVMRKIKEGKIETELRMPELGGYVVEIRRAINKLATAIVVASVIFGLFHLRTSLTSLFSGSLSSFWTSDAFLAVVLIIVTLIYFRKR